MEQPAAAPVHGRHGTPASEHVPAKEKVAYGLGWLIDYYFQNIVNVLYSPIFVIAMKLDPAVIGLAMSMTKFVGAVTDPIAGMVSDRTHTRWGRRRPYIVIGTIAGTLLLPLLWTVPGQSAIIQYAYIIVIISLFWSVYSFFTVPYQALGLELTQDYDERTRVFAWRNTILIPAFFTGNWFYWFCLRPVFGNEIIGARWLCVIVGAIMIGLMVAVIRGTRERAQVSSSDKSQAIPVIQAIRQTLNNRPFLLVQGALLVVLLGTGVDGPIGMYLFIYYAFQGDKAGASLVSGLGGTISTLSIFLVPPLALWLSTRMGKREAALVSMLIMLVSVIIIPFVLTPVHPSKVIICWVLQTVGTQIMNLVAASMMADICDEDELVTGLRREGTYIASQQFLSKMCQVIILLLGGLIPRLAGYSDFSVPPTMDKLERMKMIMIATQMTGVLFSLVMLWYYPISRERANETRRRLNARQAEIRSI